MFSFKDAGVIIAITSGTENTKKNPFKVNNIKRKGRCKLTRVLEIRSQKNDTLLGAAHSKTEAILLAKQLIKKYQENIYGKTVYISSDIDFEMEYNPSTKTQLGQYIVFGVDEGDVRINKRKNRGFE